MLLKLNLLLKKFSGKFLARDWKNRTNDGVIPSRVIVVEFPDYETAIKCYDSSEYQNAHNILKGHVERHHQK